MVPSPANLKKCIKITKNARKCSNVIKSHQKWPKCNKSYQIFENFRGLRWPPAARCQLKMTPKVQKGTENDKSVKSEQIWATLGRIAAKPRSHMWSTIWKGNYQKLTFGEGVQPWDLSSCPGRIKSYRFIMEMSIFMRWASSYAQKRQNVPIRLIF